MTIGQNDTCDVCLLVYEGEDFGIVVLEMRHLLTTNLHRMTRSIACNFSEMPMTSLQFSYF